MIKQLNLFVLALMMSSFVNADTLLKIQNGIIVQEINGAEVKKDLFNSYKSEYSLESGQNDLIVYYYQYFDAENGIGAHDIVKSSPVYIKTPVLRNNETYRLAMINPPKNNDDAKKYAKQPEFALYNSYNELLMTQIGGNTKKGIIHSIFNEQKIDQRQPQVVYTLIEPDIAHGDTLNHLLIAWKNATKEDKQKFMLWIAEQVN